MEMPLHIYFCTHLPVIKVVVTMSMEEKFVPHSYFVKIQFAPKSCTKSRLK